MLWEGQIIQNISKDYDLLEIKSKQTFYKKKTEFFRIPINSGNKIIFNYYKMTEKTNDFFEFEEIDFKPEIMEIVESQINSVKVPFTVKANFIDNSLYLQIINHTFKDFYILEQENVFFEKVNSLTFIVHGNIKYVTIGTDDIYYTCEIDSLIKNC